VGIDLFEFCKSLFRPGIRWTSPAQLPVRLESLGVPDTDPMWRAVHYLIDEAEAETILHARKKLRDTNACLAAVGAGEGIDLVRAKLNQARANALRIQRGQQ
jgi:glycerol dehydrogenase-like iron-containing ADH family enzyme